MTASEDRLSPLHDEHVALGAAMTSFGGWLMPLRYDSDLAEHHAVRKAAGLFDLSHMGEIDVVGPQAAAALDYALIGNLSAVGVGRARYTMIVADDGTVIDDLVVYRLEPERFMVVANASNAPVVLGELQERTAGFAASVVDRTALALIAVQGPRAEEILLGLVGDSAADDVRGVRYYAAVPVAVAGVETLLARTGYTGEDGFELFVEPEHAVSLWRALLETGTPMGLVPAGLASRDSLRLEAGMPLYGHELSRDVTPYDAGLGRTVKLDKVGPDGEPLDFVGRAALEYRASRDARAELDGDAPARVLVGLQGLGRRPARAGYAVVVVPGAPASGEEGADGEPTVVGRVTSGAPSPTLGHPIALAYVDAALAEPGTELGVDVRGRTEPVRVVPLPFYRRAN